MFLIAYEFMRDNYEHKQFRGKLYDMQNEEDKKQRDEWVKIVTDESLRMIREDLDPLLLSHPVPQCVVDMFKNNPGIPQCDVGNTMRFTRPSKQDKVKWANETIEIFAVQVKEKYGTLRFYMSCETDEITDLISDAEALSSQTCESCGEPAKMRGKFWLEVKCDKCYEERT
jgi:hypothetical protein